MSANIDCEQIIVKKRQLGEIPENKQTSDHEELLKDPESQGEYKQPAVPVLNL